LFNFSLLQSCAVVYFRSYSTAIGNRQSATPNKMPKKCVVMGVSRKSWYLGHLKELLKILLDSEIRMKGLHILSISFFVEAEYTAKSDVVGRGDFGFSWYFTIFNRDYLVNGKR
jgi:hypothetical protein